MDRQIREILSHGTTIPAHPLALTADRKLDETRQRALSRYYVAAGVGGLAVAVHTTQFAIRHRKIGLLKPVLALAAEEMNRADQTRRQPLVRVGGICGPTRQALAEARQLYELKYHAGLLSLAALRRWPEAELIAHCRDVGEVIPLIGFYLQSSVGGRPLSYDFWRRFCELPSVVAIKIAPFNRYQTLDVVRAAAESGRHDISLYTGNDDNIVLDLLARYCFKIAGKTVECPIVGGLLGHWAVWTQRAVQLFDECHAVRQSGAAIPADLIRRASAVTDSNAAFFDATNGFGGCIAGLHEVLRRQGLLEGLWCLDPAEGLGPGQLQEIDRIYQSYPELSDDAFVAEHRDEWLRG
jgi:hypothetical protein